MQKRVKNKAAKKNTRGAKTKNKENAVAPPVDVRQEVLKMVENHAPTMTAAVIKQAEAGQLATVKYLFEAADILRAPKDASEGTKEKEEDSLAETLLDRLHIPKVPVAADEEENSVVSECSEAKREDKESANPDQR